MRFINILCLHLHRLSAFFIIAFVLLALFGPAFAKPQPPKELDGLFEMFSKLGSSISGLKWDAAASEADAIKQRFVTLYSELKKSASTDIIFQFGSAMDELKSNVTKKNQTGSLTSLAALQSLFVRIMDIYEYRNPPVLTLIDMNLAQTKDEFAGGRYEGVTREMQECIVLHGHAQKFLKERGASQQDIDEFKMAMISTKMASQVSDKTETGSGIGKVTAIWKRIFKAN